MERRPSLIHKPSVGIALQGNSRHTAPGGRYVNKTRRFPSPRTLPIRLPSQEEAVAEFDADPEEEQGAWAYDGEEPEPARDDQELPL